MKKVFKFGGASVKDAEGVKRVAEILKNHGAECCMVVISAMGKTTNALEKVVDAYVSGSDRKFELLEEVKAEHLQLMKELFADGHPIYDEVLNQFVEIEWALEDEPRDDYGYTYDQIVSVGELVSTRIVSAWLNEVGLKNEWLDARDIVKTDNTYRNAQIDWEETQAGIDRYVKSGTLYVSQGFIGCTSENFTTTLGREGSDYSAAIFAYCLDVDEVHIWKDVRGILNADPKCVSDAKLIEILPFKEAIELAYYGAKVIHPKTIQPLWKKEIPLRVRSFLDKDVAGTMVGKGEQIQPLMPSFIIKENQTLLSLDSPDLEFIQEAGLSTIFGIFAKHGIALNMMQQAATSFSACFDAVPRKMDALLEDFRKAFLVRYNEGLTLHTVRHYDVESGVNILQDKEIILEQRSRHTLQMLVRG